MERFLEWDRAVFIYCNSLFGPAYDSFWLFITEIRNWIPLYLLIIFYYIFKYTKKQAALAIVFLLLAAGSALILTNLTKEFFQRIRPNNSDVFDGTIKILLHPSNYSFFSGHACFSFSFASYVAATAFKSKLGSVLCYFWAFLIAFSRLQIGVHFPSDIVVGSIIGLGVGLGYSYLNRLSLRKWNDIVK